MSDKVIIFLQQTKQTQPNTPFKKFSFHREEKHDEKKVLSTKKSLIIEQRVIQVMF